MQIPADACALQLRNSESVNRHPPPVIQPSDEDMELDREMEYPAEPEEALDRGADEGHQVSAAKAAREAPRNWLLCASCHVRIHRETV